MAFKINFLFISIIIGISVLIYVLVPANTSSLFTLSSAQAQEIATSTSQELIATSTILIDGADVFYNKVTEFDTDLDGNIDRLAYFLNNALVLTTYDTNFDVVADLWLVYDENSNIIKEVMDTNGDEQFDLIVSMDEDGQVVDVEGFNLPANVEVLGEQYMVNNDSEVIEDTNQNNIELFNNPDVKYWWLGFTSLVILALFIWKINK